MHTIDFDAALERSHARGEYRTDRKARMAGDLRHVYGRKRLWLTAVAGGLTLTAVAAGLAYFQVLNRPVTWPQQPESPWAVPLAVVTVVLGLAAWVVNDELVGRVRAEVKVYADRVHRLESTYGPDLADAVATLAGRGWVDVAHPDKHDLLGHLTSIARHAGGPAAARAADTLPTISLFGSDSIKRLHLARLSALGILAGRTHTAGGAAAAAVRFACGRNLTTEEIGLLDGELAVAR